MVHVLVSGRVLDRNVGGNTRYARAIYSRIGDFGISHSVLRPGPFPRDRLRSVRYAAIEGVIAPIAARDADVIHYPADTGAWFPGRRPIVATVHGIASLHVDNVRTRGAEKLWRVRVGRLVASAARVITVSESSARDIADAFPCSAGKLAVIYHGIDHERFRPTPELHTPAVLQRRVEGPYLAYVGNIEPRKNIVELVRAAAKIFAATQVPLVVSGAPAWGYRDILSLLETTPGVIYLGRTAEADMIDILQNATAFCFPSKYEGFGFPVLEAMACGTPVICSDKGSLREVGGDAAYVLPMIDARHIADAVIELLGDGSARQELRARGLANAERFQWPRSAEQHAAVLTDAATQRRVACA